MNYQEAAVITRIQLTTVYPSSRYRNLDALRARCTNVVNAVLLATRRSNGYLPVAASFGREVALTGVA
jgi:hypothetical protein